MNFVPPGFAAFAVGIVIACGPAGAQQSATALPPEKAYHHVIPYVTGGVPDAQAEAFKSAHGAYALEIELYEQMGSKQGYTALVDVTVSDETGGTVLETRTEGPFLYARVPPGTYQVNAELNGKKVQSKPVKVTTKSTTRAVLVFPEGTSD